MAHEMTRPDRDNFIKVFKKNIDDVYIDQFEINKHGYTKDTYDYKSVMHYSMFMSIANNPSRPVMRPINCGSSCPHKLGQRDGLSLLDHKQLMTMYKCKPLVTPTWTADLQCMDSPIYQGQELDCKKYVAVGLCQVDSKPCCKCDDCKSGLKVRKYAQAKKKLCKDNKGEEQWCRS